MQEILSKEMIGQRIRSLRVQSAFSQEMAAKFLGMSRGNYSQIELGNQYPTYDILFKLAVFYNKPYDWLLHGEHPETSGCSAYVLPKPVSGSGLDKIRLVKNADYYNYLSLNKNREYIENLESIQIPLAGQEPVYNLGSYRAFEVGDYGMAGVIHKDDIITARNIENTANIIFNDIYVLVSQEEILIRRIVKYIDDTRTLVCKADNNTYPLSVVKMDELQELWHMGGIFSTKLHSIVEEMGQQLRAFEQSVTALKKNVESLKKKGIIAEDNLPASEI